MSYLAVKDENEFRKHNPGDHHNCPASAANGGPLSAPIVYQAETAQPEINAEERIRDFDGALWRPDAWEDAISLHALDNRLFKICRHLEC